MREVERLLSRQLGLNVESIGHVVVERLVHSRMATLGIARMDDYWERLQQDADELRELIEGSVVSETWFFRNHDALNALTRLLTTEWNVADRGPVRRILSIPCATGEEPYSIAIALAEAGLSREQVQIDAMDISQRALAIAERGVYRRNSFRAEASKVCEKYTRPVDGGVELLPDIRRWVRFAEGNLAEEQFQPPLSCYDVIFCRNLLIYLERHVQEQGLGTLHRLLASDGYFFVGPAETALAEDCGFHATDHAMAFVFRKTPRIMTLPATKSVRTTALPSVAPNTPAMTAHKAPSRLRLPVVPPQAPATPQPVTPPKNDLAVARRLADEGRLVEAAELCKAYIHAHGASAEAFYLQGLIHDARGAASLAVSCYRKALFLDPNYVEAVEQLAIHARRNGDVSGAERMRARTQRIEQRGKS